MRLVAVAMAVAALAALTASPAVAQYTPPQSVLSVTAETTGGTPNSTVEISFMVYPLSGGPGVAPSNCQVSIVEAPGSDASVTLLGPGRAALFTGSTPGPVKVRVDCGGDGAAELTVLVSSTPGLLFARTAASGSSLDAGVSSQAGGGGVGVPMLVALGVAAGALVVAFAARQRIGTRQ